MAEGFAGGDVGNVYFNYRDGNSGDAVSNGYAGVRVSTRIEDDAIVTADGCELITRGVPVIASEIEALMCG